MIVIRYWFIKQIMTDFVCMKTIMENMWAKNIDNQVRNTKMGEYLG